MPSPPLIGRLLLRAIVPRADYEYVAGDLLEEFHLIMLPSLGMAGARRWYWSQALRSALPFLLLRLRRGALASDLFFAQLAVVVPMALLHLLWTFVLSQVPLRASSIVPAFVIASMVFLVLSAACFGFTHATATSSRVGQSPFAFPAATLFMTAVILLLLDSYWIASPPLVLGVLPLSSFAGGCLARGVGLSSELRRGT